MHLNRSAATFSSHIYVCVFYHMLTWDFLWFVYGIKNHEVSIKLTEILNNDLMQWNLASHKTVTGLYFVSPELGALWCSSILLPFFSLNENYINHLWSCGVLSGLWALLKVQGRQHVAGEGREREELQPGATGRGWSPGSVWEQRHGHVWRVGEHTSAGWPLFVFVNKFHFARATQIIKSQQHPWLHRVKLLSFQPVCLITPPQAMPPTRRLGSLFAHFFSPSATFHHA